MNRPLDFQSMIFGLQRFWAEQGCLIWQPYYSQVGAGTMNPATVLRVLGPEPWKVAYVEPSVRPDDGRYGDNPYRLQQHTQFQVILKPDPGNPQELYLHSLESIGIDPRQHDIRFVEDNWESPALGAWGLGWEVWLDGQEITQFTYFQQAGGIQLDPVSVEITYGLERIAMPLQRVRNFKDIRWSDERTYGDVHLMGEFEHSKYYFEVADVERLREMYRLFESEAESAIAQGLVLPAHDYILKCSHTFNVLDTRGAVGVTERQALFARMRDLSHRVAEAYIAQRQAREFPWMQESGEAGAASAASRPVQVLKSNLPQTLLFEIGTEELPPADLASAQAQLVERMPVLLDELRLEHGEIKVLSTPRRLVVLVEKLAASQPDRTQVVKGPPADRAFDAEGNPTKAAEGFARSKGIALQDLKVHEIDGGRYAAAVVHEAGRPALDVLAEALPGVIAGIKFDKSMRWNSSGVYFSRPIRWLLALYGEQVIPFAYAGLQSANTTRGLRTHEPSEIAVTGVEAYLSALKAQGIIIDAAERRTAISAQVKAIMQQTGGDPKALDEGVLDEVNNLVEAPTALRGLFGEEHLRLPPEVLISVMKKYQRYFPVFDGRGKLLPYFIAVRNGDDQHVDIVADGNEQVIRARFADADFFINQDLQHKLSDNLPRLATLAFQKKLGSMLDKSQRIERAMPALSAMLSLNAEEMEVASRAAVLCKADLVSHMVVEMTSLQGVMGRYYARYSGESDSVAKAIYEHYLPRSNGDALPQARAGLLIGIGDRLDTLAGLFAAGLAPSGTKDPFAQRRAALGLVQALIGLDVDFDLRAGLRIAAGNLPIEASPESQNACFEFILGRLQSYLLEQGFRYDIVNTVLTAQGHNPAGAARAMRSLTQLVTRAEWPGILPAYARCVRITRDHAERYIVDPAVFVEPADADLYTGITAAEAEPRHAGSMEDFVRVFQPLIPSINRFFEAVLVMAEDPAVRANRLGMLQRIAALANGVADFSKLEGF